MTISLSFSTARTMRRAPSFTSLSLLAPLGLGMLLVTACTPPLEPEFDDDDDAEPWSPASVQAPLEPRASSGVTQASVGDGATCVVTLAGNAKCWGRGEHGQLGRGDIRSIGDDELPGSEPFVELGAGVQQILTNGEQTLALRVDGEVIAWGLNAAFELGLQHDETIGDDETPASAQVSVSPQLGGPAVQIALGADFACARLVDGGVLCWGANDYGQLGRGHTETIGDDEPPSGEGPIALGGAAIELSAGAHHACVVLDTGSVRCWGLGADGRLGRGSTETIGDDEQPDEGSEVDLGGTAVAVTAGDHHTCALLDDGTARCWGLGADGRLGYGNVKTVGDDETPKSAGAVPVGGTTTALAAGLGHTCALLDTGDLRCFGANDQGQLGLGHVDTIGDDETPAEAGMVDMGSRRVEAVFSGVGARSTCAWLEGSSLRCWGNNDEGQLGQGHTLTLSDEPAEVPGHLPDIVIIDDED